MFIQQDIEGREPLHIGLFEMIDFILFLLFKDT